MTFLQVKFWVNLEVTLEKKSTENYSRFTKVGLIISSTSNCVFDSLSDTTTHQQLGMLS